MELRYQTGKSGTPIREILPDCQIFGAEDIRVSSCCHDWNHVQPGDLYVAKVGMEKDGHDHIQMAAKKGASAILCERFVVSDVPLCLVEDTREAYGQICQNLVGDPKDRLKTVGITGTDGKTIVGHLIREVFRKSRMRTGMISSLGYCDGFVTSKLDGTTPDSPQLADCLSELVANNCQAAIVENSSIGIAERRISGIEFDACVFTNVRKDHLDSHGTVENYRKIKTRLLERLKSNGFVVLNSDDQFLNRWVKQLKCPVLTYGMHNDAEVTAEVIQRTSVDQTFLLVAGNESIPVRTPMIGDYYVRHCLAAATVGLTFGLSLEDIVSGIESIDSIPGRMERIQRGQDFSVYVDSAQTPNQLCGMLKTLARLPAGGKIRCVFGGAERITSKQRAGLGTVAERYADQQIISGVEIHNESALEVAHEILDGFDDVSKAHVIPNRAAAIQHVLESAEPDDKVLICGLGEKTTSFGFEAELAMTDRELCETWFDHPESLNALTRQQEKSLPISYRIDNYR
ncbi:MAG: UDP-N-acetylmuramyl-tripeptide synthetase [Planctomycetota bacterium]|nr:UDP-N-acetylmuramyl-tripeptide synthetase [Planctomycetota bacterium]